MYDVESDYCEECTALGDDTYIDGNGYLVDACFDCPFGHNRMDDDEE